MNPEVSDEKVSIAVYVRSLGIYKMFSKCHGFHLRVSSRFVVIVVIKFI